MMFYTAQEPRLRACWALSPGGRLPSGYRVQARTAFWIVATMPMRGVVGEIEYEPLDGAFNGLTLTQLRGHALLDFPAYTQNACGSMYVPMVSESDSVGVWTFPRLCHSCMLEAWARYRGGMGEVYEDDSNWDEEEDSGGDSSYMNYAQLGPFTVLKDKRLVGVEIEALFPREFPRANGSSAEGSYVLDRVEREAERKTDGSVQGDGLRGLEFASYPASGDALLRRIRVLCSGLRELGGRVNHTCGLHVHLDCSGDSRTRRAVIEAWPKIEPMILAMVPYGRRENSYCKPVGTDDHWPRNGRYYTLNPDAFDKYGTLEVRVHQGTLAAAKIERWVRFLLWVFDAAERGRFKGFARAERRKLERAELAAILTAGQAPHAVKKEVVKRIKRYGGNPKRIHDLGPREIGPYMVKLAKEVK